MMRRLGNHAAAAIALLSSSAAQAQVIAVPTPVQVVVPMINLSGTTSGTGKLTAGLDIRSSMTGAWAEWDYSLAPTLTVASSDGLANLIKIPPKGSSEGNTDFSIGLTMSFLKLASLEIPLQVEAARVQATNLCLGPARAAKLTSDAESFLVEYAKDAFLALNRNEQVKSAVHAELAKSIDNAIDAQFKGCRAAGVGIETCTCDDKASASVVKQCTTEVPKIKEQVFVDQAKKCHDSDGATCSWIFKERTALEGIRISETKLCPKGVEQLKAAKHTLRQIDHQPNIINFGLVYNPKQLEYLSGKPGPTATLTETKKTYSNFLAGFLYTHVAERGADQQFTFELPIIYEYSWKAAKTKGKWCASKGQVTTEGIPATVESCKELSTGDPTNSSEISAALLFGFVSGMSWRWAAGPTFTYDVASDKSTPLQIGFQAPVYMSFLKGQKGYSGDYEGIVRLVPKFALDMTDGQMDASGQVMVELLGKRTMFGNLNYWP